LPHDGDTQDKVHDASYAKAFRDLGYEVEVVPNQGKGAAKARIEALRRVLPISWFDEKCEPGLSALGWYHEKRDEFRNIGLGPDHDWSSHSSDAAGLVAICYEAPKIANSEKPIRRALKGIV
jgi:phage terminase large subunit